MIVERYLSFLFEQEPPGVIRARQLNPQLYSILKGIKVDLPTFNTFRTIATIFQNNMRRCQRMEELQSKLCVCNSKIELFRRELPLLSSGQRLCSIQRDPSACREKVRNKSREIIEQIKKEQQRIVKIRYEIIARRNKEVEQRRNQVSNVGKNIPREVSVER